MWLDACRMGSMLWQHSPQLRSAPPQFSLYNLGYISALNRCNVHTSAYQSAAEMAPSAAPPARHLAPWVGLPAWRASAVDQRRVWGAKGPEPSPAPPCAHPHASLAECGRGVLLTADPYAKAALSHAAWSAYRSGAIPVGVAAAPDAPARPAAPLLVPAREVPTHKQSGLPLAVYLLHTLAHIELNAIDLAWDSLTRFSALRLPAQFYADFARVADDESRHLGWCLQRLQELGYAYGCMPAHDLLWQGCSASAGDVRARLAVVPMSQEARGLDAGQRLADRLVGFGDNRSAAIVARISQEERAHVAVGVAWFQAVCAAQGAAPGSTFAALLERYAPDLLSGAFNHAARGEVGLPREWYDKAQWGEEMQREVAAAEAAAAEGAGGEGAGAGSGASLEELRQRLEAMVAAELQACG